MKRPLRKDSSLIHARRLLRFVSRAKKSLSPLLILTHDFPDPDALGSAFALHYLCEEVFGIPSKIVYRGIIGRMENRAMIRILRIPAVPFSARHLKKYPHVALVDTQPAFKNNPYPANRTAALVIDQHAFLDKPNARFFAVDPDCGATSVIMARALLLMKGRIPVRVATALVYGILSDTLNLFRFSREEVIRAYLGILPFSDLRALSKIQNPSKSRKAIVTLERGIQNAMVRRGLIVSHLRDVENPDFVSQVADFLLSYKRMFWCMCTGRYRGKLFVSLRIANKRTNAGEILRDIFDNPREAGGHDVIAGGSFKVGGNASEGTWVDIEQDLVDRLEGRLRIRGKGDFYHPFRLQSGIVS